MKVLIVDDSTLIRRSLIRLIDKLENVTEIVEATNVPEAIRTVKEYTPDIVILDIRMPGGTGFSVLRELRRRLDRVLVIILTKYSTEEYRDEAVAEGADYFFDKSNEFKQVIGVIRDYRKDIGGRVPGIGDG